MNRGKKGDYEMMSSNNEIRLLGYPKPEVKEPHGIFVGKKAVAGFSSRENANLAKFRYFSDFVGVRIEKL